MQNQLKLWYDTQPPKSTDEIHSAFPSDSSTWEKWSLPLGNGYFGASVFGYTETERIQITENSLSNPYKYDPNDRGKNAGLNNFAEIYIDIGHQNVSDYRRELDLDNAVSKISYMCDGVRYTREYFTSYPDKVMVMKFTSDKLGKVCLTVCPKIPFIGDHCVCENDGFGKSGEVKADGDVITLSGEMQFYGIKFEGQLKVCVKSGCLCTNTDSISVIGADEVIIYFACGTNYQSESRVFTESDPKKKLAPYEHPHGRICKYLDDASKKSYEDLYNAHLFDYKSLFDRVKLNLNESIPAVPTDNLLSEYKEGKTSRYLEILLYQYGRYLLIASSRQGCLPANLRGIWNFYNSSPWSSGYWHNINVQMNYWPAEIANLSELFLPYADYNQAYMEQAKKHADRFIMKNYPSNYTEAGTNGWIIGTGGWLYTIEGIDNIAHSGPGTGAFTSLLFWDYYDYTRNEKFLREICYPVLRDMSIFFSKVLVETDGKLLIEQSASPENMHNGAHYHTKGCAFDQQMVYENYKRTLQASEILGIKEPIIDTIKSQINRLDPVLIGKSGQIKEYREEEFYSDIGDPHHRHISQLVGLYPATIINSNTKEWLDAATVTLTERGDKSTGWAAAHRLCLWTRVKNGKKAMDLIRSMLCNNILPNLWDTHPPFQIDGNFGYTAGVSEMLVQSNAGYIELLQALPDEWNNGSFEGLVARGNFVVDCVWKNKKAVNVKVSSRAGGVLSVCDDRISKANIKYNGLEHIADNTEGNVFSIDTNIGDVLEITFDNNK